MHNKTNSVVSENDKLEKKGYHQSTVEVYQYFRGWVLIVIKVVFWWIYRFGCILHYSNKIGLAVIIGVFTTGCEFSVILFYTIFRTGSLFWYFSIVSIFNGISRGKKYSLSLDVYLEKDGSKNEIFKDTLNIDGFVSRIVCWCKLSFSWLLQFSEADGIEISDKSWGKTHRFVVPFFHKKRHYQLYRFLSKLQFVVKMF